MSDVVAIINNVVYYVDSTPKIFNKSFISTYIILCNDRCIIIDPGCKNMVDNLCKSINYLCREVSLIIPTHIHIDHGGAVGSLLKMYPASITLVHPKGGKHLVDPSKLWSVSLQALGPLARIYGEPEASPEERVKMSYDNMELVCGDITLVIIHTPGHASHHQVIYLPEYHMVFTGDAAGIYDYENNIILPTLFPPLNIELYLKSLDKIINLNPKYICFTHFGYTTNIKSLLKYRDAINHWLCMLKNKRPISIDETKEILLSDAMFKRIYEYTKDKPMLKHIFNLSVKGLYDQISRP